MNKTKLMQLEYAGLFRRLFAIIYDCFLLTALLFIVSAIATAMNKGEAVKPDDAIYPLFVLILLGLSYLYFAWFWIHGGQTLGMKTWRIKLQADGIENSSNRGIGWLTSAVRFFAAIVSWMFAGAGFLWSLFDNKKRTWHDLVSRTVLVDLRK